MFRAKKLFNYEAKKNLLCTGLVMFVFGFNTTFVRVKDTRDNAPVTITPQAVATTQSCLDLIDTSRLLWQRPGEINKVRRQLMLSHPDCFWGHYYDFFAEQHWQRIQRLQRKHLVIHIPKTGGTALCMLARHGQRLGTPKTPNCWGKPYYKPIWSWSGKYRDRRPVENCSALNVMPKFVMNENYVDHPLCASHRMIAILIRHPVQRAMSNVHHLQRMKKKLPNRTARFFLVQNNYMTWSLSSGHGSISENATLVIPKEKHLTLAQDTIMKLDYILEASHPNAACWDAMLRLMGFVQTTLPRANSAQTANYTHAFSRKEYERRNALDIQLYQRAQQLLEVDCEFYMRLQQERIKLPA